MLSADLMYVIFNVRDLRLIFWFSCVSFLLIVYGGGIITLISNLFYISALL